MIFLFVVFNISDDFKNKSKENPANLFRQCDYCNSPQPRYKLHPNHEKAKPDFKYLKFEQCLPGCMVNLYKTLKDVTYLTTSESKQEIVSLTSDVSCEAYDAPTSHISSSTSQMHSKRTASQLSSSKISPPPTILQQKDSFNKGRLLIFYIS